MKIVIVLPAAPHPFGNTAARWFYVLIKGLVSRGHFVSCLTVTDEPKHVVEESSRFLSLEASTGRLKMQIFPMACSLNSVGRKLRSLRRPFSELYYADGFRRAFEEEIRNGYDVVHLEQLWSGWAGLDVPRALLNIHHFEIIDWEERTLGSWSDKKAMLQMTRATSMIVRGSKHMRVFSSRLFEKARTINPQAKYWVIPFALDPGLYPMQPPVTEPVVGLTGSMHWYPSRSAAERLVEKIWPKVKKRCSTARLYIAGWNAKKYLDKYADRPGVTIADSFSHPTEFFSRVGVLVYAPSRGSGMKIKVMESMAYGVPVVTTSEGVEGLSYSNGTHCWVDEDDDAIAERTVELLSHRQHWSAMRDSARALICDSYSPAPIVDKLCGVHSEVASH